MWHRRNVKHLTGSKLDDRPIVKRRGGRTRENETDMFDSAACGADSRPDVDPKAVRFTDLYDWVIALPGFDDDPKRCGEKILEAIQSAWIEEAQ